MSLRLKEGDIVKHFKRSEENDSDTLNHLYKILFMDAINTETNESMVVYQALYPPYKVFCRPKDMFLGKVDKNKYPNIKQEYRLEKYNE